MYNFSLQSGAVHPATRSHYAFSRRLPAGAPFGAPESHFGQVDVNDLLTKLISTGIIPGSAPAQPEASEATGEGETWGLVVLLKITFLSFRSVPGDARHPGNPGKM